MTPSTTRWHSDFTSRASNTPLVADNWSIYSCNMDVQPACPSC